MALITDLIVDDTYGSVVAGTGLTSCCSERGATLDQNTRMQTGEWMSEQQQEFGPPDADYPDRADEPDVALDETDDQTGEQPEPGEDDGADV